MSGGGLENIKREAAKLSKALCETHEYKEYLLAKIAVDNDPALKARIDQYRKIHLGFQAMALNGQNPSFDEEKKVSAMHWELMLDEKAGTYLQCEKKMVDAILDIYRVIGQSCPVDLSFLD